MNINVVNPLEDKLRPLVFTSDELDEKPFFYHYKWDANNELVPGDSTDEWVDTLSTFSLWHMTTSETVCDLLTYQWVMYLISQMFC